MMHPTRAGIRLIRLGDSDFVSATPEDDLRGKVVYDAQGQRIGSVSDLYIDRQDREVRYLEVGAGGFLGIGEKNYLVPVEAVTEVAADRVTIEPDRTEKVAGSVPFDTKVAPRPPTSRPTPTPGCLTATLRAPPTASTPRYGTSTDRTSGRRVGVTGLVAAETDPSPATSGGTYAAL
jgi:sporulation protein YlmC with PRC-barrel domain